MTNLEKALMEEIKSNPKLYDPTDREIDMQNLAEFLDDVVHEVRCALWEEDPNFDATVIPPEKKIDR